MALHRVSCESFCFAKSVLIGGMYGLWSRFGALDGFVAQTRNGTSLP